MSTVRSGNEERVQIGGEVEVGRVVVEFGP